jgi:hypothetical protein
MPLLALLCYGFIIASAYNFFHSSTILTKALGEMVDYRRQLLVSPSHVRRKICSNAALQANPLRVGGLPSGRLACAAPEVAWVKQGAWTNFCLSSPLSSEQYAPRFYRLRLVCTYIFAGISVGLPQVEWEIFR